MDMEHKHHPNCRCALIMIKIHVLDLPDHIPFVISGRRVRRKRCLNLAALPVKILFGQN